MTSTPSCPREAEVLDLVWTSQWPARAERSLVEHVASCVICHDLATVAAAMGDLHEATRADVKVPDAGAVWYRAQVRARQELARRAARPVAAAQVAAAALSVGAAATAWRLGGASLAQWWRGFTMPDLPQLGPLPDLTGLASSPFWPWLLAAAGAWALMVPAAFYIAKVVDKTR